MLYFNVFWACLSVAYNCEKIKLCVTVWPKYYQFFFSICKKIQAVLPQIALVTSGALYNTLGEINI